ncbi:PGPGW domain-containing protein [Thiolinea disciformis]|uniref:PGPGW domain-containing protein n=1 Tax=Thiolinea disciformis TaxID=125614 RepID=UPI00036E47B9|nr:PGPGW domain-containing protein [Thiolinea disciformis]
MFDTVLNFINHYKSFFVSLGMISVALVIISIILLPWLISLIPADYFQKPRTEENNKVLWQPINIVRNIIGLVIVLAGIAMLVLPGQGLLAILVGIGVMNFPGKYELERWIVSRPGVLSALNWVRSKVNKPPLLV